MSEKLSLDGAASRTTRYSFQVEPILVDEKAVADGDTVTVYVGTSNLRETECVPQDVQAAAVERAQIR
nr:staphylococcal-like nuclease CAN2 [Tanacetum cinerariifolium]